ncbi:hypothetical protein O1L44_16390 [Streptomyces noursei]|uniref:hypothetical protein n=1 Tax=Streptomyces noursei TaxID=1971 RepID=UPI00081C6403|nr:hypothetical protein SNOUR_20945 [Streptomyces noursei ATCC 11455]MCZ0994369.1 hypothetical protein [Streptomyces noursei]
MSAAVRAEARAEQKANALLERIRKAADAEQLGLVQGIVLDHALGGVEFSANDFRDRLPDGVRHGLLGAAIRGLAASRTITNTGRTVPSTAPATHGHRIAVYRLTAPDHGEAAA